MLYKVLKFRPFLWPSKHTRCRTGVLLGVVLIPVLFANSARCQDYLTSTGMPAFSAPEPVELGFVDASSGNLHLSIPLGSYPQRGTSQPQPVTLEYDSNIWQVYSNDGITEQWAPVDMYSYSVGGWNLSYGVGLIAEGISVVSENCGNDISWEDKNATVHTFHLNLDFEQQDSSCPVSADAFATDSSGYHMFASNYGGTLTIYAPDGTIVYTSYGTPVGSPYNDGDNQLLGEDSNGNYMYVAYGETLNDTLGRQIASTPSPGSYLCYNDLPNAVMPTSQGTAEYSISCATINVNTDFNQLQVGETSTSIQVIRSLTLPDAAGSTYYFTYDCDENNPANPARACSSQGQGAYYGQLTGITLPTGGTVSYSYTTFADVYKNKSSWLTSRQSGGGTWSYTPQPLSSCNTNEYWPNSNCKQQTTVSSPTGYTLYTFGLNNGAWPATIVKEDLSGTVLSTVTNTWDFSHACVTIGCIGNQFVRLLSQQTTVPSANGNNLTKQTQYTYDSPQFGNQYGNQTAINEWGYIPADNSFNLAPDRATYLSYLYYTSTNNINRPTSVTLCNKTGSDSACPGGGSRVSQTLYTYDASPLTSVTGVANHDDTYVGMSYTTRGNPTSISQWVSGSNYLTTSYTYDTTGQVVSKTDPAGNITHYYYTDGYFTDAGNGTSPSKYSAIPPTNAYLTKVTDPIGTQTIGYYWGSGHVAVATDYNNQPTYSHYQDGLDRQTEEIDPIGWSLANYSSASQSDMYTAVATVPPSTACASCQHTQTILDSWGRTASQILVNNPIGPVEVDSSYDTDGRLSTQSHPYSGSGDPNDVFETFSYDALDRQLSITHPDGQVQQVAYGPNVGNLGASAQQGSTAIYGYAYPQVSEDESGHLLQQWWDDFGRIVEVDEPNASSGSLTPSPSVTNYLYDAGDRLTQVIQTSTQGTQTRTFTYDGLGRKINENTPEGGSVFYSYTTSGGGLCSGDPSNVCYRTDARGVVSTYTYDHGNRLTGIAYTIPSGQNIALMPSVCTTTPNGTRANVCYYYDQGGTAAHAIGQLTKMVDLTGSETYSHDANGRVTQLSKVVNGQTFKIGYRYDAGGDVTQITYPSGRVVQQAYNQVGQLCQIAPSAPGCTAASSFYAANFSYNAPGMLTGFNYGNSVTAAFYYSPDRTQLTYLAYAKGNSTYFNLQYSYQQSSQYSPPCPTGTKMNNGSIQCIADNVDSGRTVNYSYDPLRRMSSALTCGSPAFHQWGLAETYDNFGNRWTQTVTEGSGPSPNLSFGLSNQPLGYTYDPSGNMTVEPLSPPNNMTYDGENRLTAFSGGGGAASYTYDGNGLRVVKSATGGSTMVSIFSGSQKIAEYDNGAVASAPSREYVAGPTGVLAMIANGTTTYYHQDHLSVRLTTDGTSGSPTYGQVLSQQGHYPFGESWYSNQGSGDNWVFTSYDRDSESGLDYALARYYDSRTGTFCSADPLAGDPSDPQSWNRYAYGRNDPIDITDPSGQHWWNWLLVGLSLAGDVLTGGATTPGSAALMAGDTTTTIGDLAAFAKAVGTMAALNSAVNSQLQDPSQGQNTQGNAKPPVYCLPNVMAAMDLAWTKQIMGNMLKPKSTEAGFPVYQQPNGSYNVGNGPAGGPPEIQTGKIQGFGIQAPNPGLAAVFHTHPDGTSGQPSTPSDTAGPEGSLGDTGSAVKNTTDIYVISNQGLAKAPATGPANPKWGKDNSPWIVQGNGVRDWLKKLKKMCGPK
ncbi:MAG: RHS repeat-associated core domain-containing protein [Terriglobales bacterium]